MNFQTHSKFDFINRRLLALDTMKQKRGKKNHGNVDSKSQKIVIAYLCAYEHTRYRIF